jgi:hypothetical protein
MKLKKVFPIAAMLLVLFMGSCNKEEGLNLSSATPSSESSDALSLKVHRKTVLLGVAGQFVILTKSGITDVFPSAVTGNVGTSPITGAAIHLTCTEVTGKIYTVDAAGPLPCRVINPSKLTTAVGDMQTAYVDAAGRSNPDFLNLGAGNIGGATLTEGLYKWTSALNIPTDITISGGCRYP